ncbi:hypothetical protein JHD48_04420 [Sulfurimonas sp. SAG-AH-194-I05]|nr:hypothetical protein [Sulfurimonas sp. SAG-AH-194-I05]MDF1874974.1 hypothetical protein [Sulfurimonas sp. SAG-AH-194-I05]
MIKKFKREILSVLLLAFTFFIVHDYVIESFSEGIQFCKIHFDKEHECTNTHEESASQLHDSFHTMFESYIDTSVFIEKISLHEKRLATQLFPISFFSTTPHRPPVL